MFERILGDILVQMEARWQERKRPLAPEIAWAQERYTDVLVHDGSTLDALLRKVGLRQESETNPLAGRMTALLSLVSRLPRRVCILVHTADSLIWGYYVGTMEIVMGQFLNELSPADQLTVWLQTDEAQDWQLRLLYFPEQLATNDPPIDHDDITSHLLHNYIYPAARRRPNHRTQTHTNAGR